MASVSQGPNDVTIVSPGKDQSSDFSVLRQWCQDNASTVKKLVHARGGVLFRGWDMQTVSHAEQLLYQDIGYEAMEMYPPTFLDFNERAARLGVPPGGGLTQRKLSRGVPPVQDGVVQVPHVEFGIGPHRPRVVSFFVETPPAAAGSTARAYLPDAYRKMSPPLQRLLRDNGWGGGADNNNCVQPALLVHPETGEDCCLQLYTFSRQLAPIAFQAYCQVRAKERPDLPYATSIPYDGPLNFTMTLVRRDGTKFTMPRELQLEYYRCVFACVTLQYWEKGDLLLFDNVLYCHFRMPGSPPRKLHAIFLNQIDTRQLYRPDAPECVRQNATKKVPGAIDGILSQLGIGGNMWILWLTMCLPDFLFIWLGKIAWVHGGGYATVAKQKSFSSSSSSSSSAAKK